MNTPARYMILLLGLLVLGFPSVLAQNPDPYLDSLQQELEQATLQDSNYVLTQIRIASRLKYKDPVRSISYAEQGVETSKKLGDPKTASRAYNMLGVAYAQQNRYASAVQAFRQAIRLGTEADYLKMIGEANNNLAITYKNLGDYSQSLKGYLKAEEVYNSMKYAKGLAGVSNNLGNVYRKDGQFDLAAKYYKKSLAVNRGLKNDAGYASAQLNLGILYSELKEEAQSLPKLDSALVYFQKVGNTRRKLLAFNALADLHVAMKNFEEAKPYLDSTLLAAEALGYQDIYSSTLRNLAKVSMSKGEYQTALEYAQKSQIIADSIQSFPMRSRSEEFQAEVYEKMGNWKEALFHHQRYKSLSDSVIKEQRTKLFLAQQVKQEVLEQEEELKSQALQLDFLEKQVSLENKWKWTLAAASIFLLFAGILYYQKYQNRKTVALELEVRNELISSQKAKIEEIDKVKTRFFTNISHEFRTPLNLILGPLRDHKENIPPSELGMMSRNAERLLRLINQLLDLSKLEVGQIKLKPKNIDIFPFLRGLSSTFGPQANQKDISFHLDIPPKQVWVQADTEKLEKIVYNLLSNAFKFTPAGGKVSFFVALDKDYQLRMVISDSGLGVPEHVQDKIFDRFYQVDGSSTRPFEGTGIGLALTKELVDLHEGTIILDSKVQEGCRFTVVLPLAPPNDSGVESPPESFVSRVEEIGTLAANTVQTSSAEKPILLVVEDHQDLRNYLIAQLKEEYQFLEAANGEEGLALAIEHIPDIVITDVMMPKMDGVEMTQKLKTNEKTSHIPVILLTAKTDPQTRKEGFEYGADQYLSKPFDPAEIRARLQSVWKQSNRIREKYSQSIYLKPSELEVEDHEARFLESVMKAVEAHLDNSEFTVVQLQEEVGMSRMQLHRKLKALTGKSASEFIRHIRLQQAAELLRHPGAQVADVAYRVGFSHLSYFAKSFKEQFGQVPSKYMKTVDG